MKNSAEVAKAFRDELQALLDKYGAELSAKDHYQGYPECGEDIRMTVDIPAVLEMGYVTREYAEIDLGAHVFPSGPF